MMNECSLLTDSTLSFCIPLLLNVMFDLLESHSSAAKSKKSLTRKTHLQSNN